VRLRTTRDADRYPAIREMTAANIVLDSMTQPVASIGLPRDHIPLAVQMP
jgi:hypothetical protein